MLLVAKEHLRRATTEECAAAEMIAKDATLTADQKNYEDRTKNPEAAGPPVIPVATPADDEEVYERRDYNMKRIVMSQAGGPNPERITRQEVFDWATGRRLDNRAVHGLPSEILCAKLPAGVRSTLTRLYYRRQGELAVLLPEARLPLVVEDAAEQLALEIAGPGEDEDQVMLEDVRPAALELEAPREDQGRVAQPQAVRRKAAFDDVPISFKRPRVQEVPVGVTQLPQIAMFAVLKTRGKDEWLDMGCVQGLSRMLGRRVLGVKFRAKQRRELFDHSRHRSDHRLSVMLPT